jgi:hypothetical protein
MKPVIVSVTVAAAREEAYGFLDTLANHELFTDHLMVDWRYSGPRAGVGAQARAKINAPGSNEMVEITLVEADPPHRIVEELVGAGGRRRTRGTYLLEDLGSDRTRISFELAWLEAPRAERLAPPLTRAFAKRAHGKAMRRLARELK